ncbi:MAG TPA: hypothetical protein VNT56_10280, partial [Acidimicrobiales bacterium]|nr:hypothetical protein [Acidimicrobiales bacterium]
VWAAPAGDPPGSPLPPPAGAAHTGPLPLHPMTVGDILDGVFKLFKANAATIVAIVAIFSVPTQLVSAWLQRRTLDGAGLLDAFGDPSVLDGEVSQPLGGTDLWVTVVVTLVSLLVVPFVAGAVSQVVSASYLGRRLPAGPALAATLRRFWALLGGWLVCHLPALATGVLAIAVLLAGPGLGTLAIGAAFGLLVAGPALVAVSALSVAVAPAIVVEGLGPVSGVRRSWSLVRRRFWAVLGISLLAGLITTLVAGALGFVPSVAALVLGLEYGWIVLAAGGILASLVSEPIVAIAATLIYFDLRIRTEGFDLQIIASELSGP